MKPTEPSCIATSPPAPETSSRIALLLRLFSMDFVGLGLAFCSIQLALEYPQNLVLLTACIFLLLALMTGARYADIRFFNGQTGDCDPAMMAYLRAYALRTAVLASAPSTSSILLGLVPSHIEQQTGL